jgi:heterodisulfide reductase subunit D
MMQQSKQNNKGVSTKTLLKERVLEYTTRCIKCHRCMDVCPVTKGTFSIDELNQATIDGQKITSTITTFAFSCTQCGRCVPVCPVDIRRDHMMRYIKYRLRDQKPWGYTRYLFIRGPNKKGMHRIAQKLYIAGKKMATRNLAGYMETIPAEHADVLFYPGCYIYSTETMRQTLRLLNHLGEPYAVLGGVTTCCGAPHLLQGELDQADRCYELLSQKIHASNPKILLTSCAECFEVLEQIKQRENLQVEVLGVAEYLLRYPEKFPGTKTHGKIVVHDSCRFHRESLQGRAALKTAACFGELVELFPKPTSSCCYQWNHGNDPGNPTRRTHYLSTVKTMAPTLACTCLTCYEEFKKISTDVEIIDILQLFEDALDATQSLEQRR